MGLQFTKAKPDAGGHDGFWSGEESRVLVRPEEIPAPIEAGDTPAFWDQFEKVMQRVCLAKDGGTASRGVAAPFEARGVKNWGQAAALVHKDRPGELMTQVAKAVTSPWRSFSLPVKSNFIDRVCLLHELIGMGARVCFPSTFAAKWRFNVARPEEVAGAIARGELKAPDFILRQLFDMIPRDKLAADQRAFSAYPEGCPPHPSFPGGHATHAGWEATVIKLMFVCSAADRDMVDFAAENVGHFREVAGVHYRRDDEVGLWIGQECANRFLPDWFEKTIGVPAGEVKEALAEVQTDWLAF